MGKRGELAMVTAPTGPTMAAKLTAEFIGTFTLVFTACNNNMAGSQLASLSVACSLMVGVYALGSVSGANFNPAVTFSLFLAKLLGHGDMGFGQAALYWLVQLVAGVSAGIVSGATWSTALLGPTSEHGNSTAPTAGALLKSSVPLGAQGDHGLWEVFVAEVLFTALLCFVVLSVATCTDTKNEKNYYFGLAIGLTVAAGAVSIGSISGCSMNPAVSFGVSMSEIAFGTAGSAGDQIGMFFYYTLAELVGAALGCGFFAVCRLQLFGKGEKGNLLPKLCAEFIGTFYLVLTVCFVVAQGKSAPLAGVIGIASVLMACIYSTAAVSGGNLNPAVSCGLLITGNLPGKDFGMYVVVQIIAGFAAVGLVSHLETWNVTLVEHVAFVGTANEIHLANGSWAAVVVSELFYTFLLVFVVLNVAVRDAGNQYYALAIGFVVIVGGVCVGGLSGGCFNPAIALSVDFGSLFANRDGNQYGYGFLYALIELAGGAAAAGVFKLVSMKEHSADSEDSEDSASEMN